MPSSPETGSTRVTIITLEELLQRFPDLREIPSFFWDNPDYPIEVGRIYSIRTGDGELRYFEVESLKPRDENTPAEAVAYEVMPHPLSSRTNPMPPVRYHK